MFKKIAITCLLHGAGSAKHCIASNIRADSGCGRGLILSHSWVRKTEKIPLRNSATINGALKKFEPEPASPVKNKTSSAKSV
jgi:hypothetical protein